jgi:16S rRNA (adenine1518-N6/adenine1519-N6)-dimethyltransferase
VPRYVKALGQHHLRSPASCHTLVEALDIRDREVVEIGPGGGVLTGPLLEGGARSIWALERDPVWALELRRRIRDPRLSIAILDALEIEWAAWPPGALLAGNLPYNVGTPLLEAWLKRATRSPRAGVMLQWEVAERLCAAPGDDAYGGLSVLVASRAVARSLGRVPKGAFVPAPKVDGGLVLLERKVPADAETSATSEADLAALESTVRAAFSMRRKTLRNALSSRFGLARTIDALARAGIEERTRAEQLGLAEFETLTRYLSPPEMRRNPPAELNS